MPRKPWAVKGRLTLDGLTELHLLTGCCLLGAGCQVCIGGYANARALGVAPWSLRENGRDTWARHRERLLAIWRDPAGPNPRGCGFSAEAHRGAGRTGLPCWAEIQFEGAKRPRLKASWPADVKRAYAAIH